MISKIYSLCRRGLVLDEMADELHISHTAIRDEIINDQPEWMEDMIDAIPPSDMQDLVETGYHPKTIAEMFKEPLWKVSAYMAILPEITDLSARHRTRVAPPEMIAMIHGAQEAQERLVSGEQRRCTRCTIFEEARNPVEGGICLWCRVRLAGWDLLTWHEEGCPEIE